jgi:hypothetical protein
VRAAGAYYRLSAACVAFAGITAVLLLAACGDPDAEGQGAQPETDAGMATPRPSATRTPPQAVTATEAVATATRPPSTAQAVRNVEPTAPSPPQSPVTPGTTFVSPTPWPSSTPRPGPSAGSVTSITLTFDEVPGADWFFHRSNPFQYYPLSVADGILTIDSPNGGDTFGMPIDWTYAYGDDPPDPWSRYVSNARGWWIEARFRVDPLTPDACESIYDPGGIGFRGGDYNREFRFLVGTTRMCLQTLSYPETRGVIVPVDSTSNYRTYRLEVKGNGARVYVDGVLMIDYVVPPELIHGSDPGVYLGNIFKVERMVSYWDYFKFDVRGLP